MRHVKSRTTVQLKLALAAVFIASFVWQTAGDWEFFESPLFARQPASENQVNVILNHVRAEKREQFEEFVFEGLLSALRENAANDPMAKKVLDQTRMLLPAEENEDGTYTYIWLMDPWVEGGVYSYRAIIAEARGEEVARNYVEMAEGSLSAPQVRYRVSNSGRWTTW
ncbi:MAG: hypothetical protein VX453_13035 [Acidobacteriota bacterium]|nr:hypothetical protein [Acidobacteriota bacterium]